MDGTRLLPYPVDKIPLTRVLTSSATSHIHTVCWRLSTSSAAGLRLTSFSCRLFCFVLSEPLLPRPVSFDTGWFVRASNSPCFPFAERSLMGCVICELTDWNVHGRMSCLGCIQREVDDSILCSKTKVDNGNDLHNRGNKSCVSYNSGQLQNRSNPMSPS